MRRGVLIVILALLLSVFAAACTDDLPSNQAGCKAPSDVTGAIYTAKDGCLYGSILDHYADEGHDEAEGEHEAEGESHDEEETESHEDDEAVEAEESEAEEPESEE